MFGIVLFDRTSLMFNQAERRTLKAALKIIERSRDKATREGNLDYELGSIECRLVDLLEFDQIDVD